MVFTKSPPMYSVLQFWILSVFVKVTDINVFTPSAKLVDRRGAVCGRIVLDGFEDTTFFESEGPFEAILLSEADADRPDIAATACVTDRAFEWAYYTVMLIEWDGGLAERRGIGSIKKETVHQSFAPGPEWKEIVLA